MYEDLCEKAKDFKSAEALLLYCISEEYLKRTDYILQHKDCLWFVEFELITLVASQESELLHWSQNWSFEGNSLLKEISKIAELTTGVMISKTNFPVLFSWMAKHVFSLPVHNALAERQFNIAELYLDPNMSEETNQAIQLFVQNVVHEKYDKKASNRTTAHSRQDYITKMASYLDTITPDLFKMAKNNIADQKKGTASIPAPLKPGEIAATKWKNLKEKSNDNVLTTISELEKAGRELEIKWQSSTQRDKYLEAERSFRPVYSEDIWSNKRVPSLRVICASKIRRYGHEIRIDELPRELQILVRYLPELTTNSTATTNIIRNIDSNKPDQRRGHGQQRVLPKWMTQTKPTSGGTENSQDVLHVEGGTVV